MFQSRRASRLHDPPLTPSLAWIGGLAAKGERLVPVARTARNGSGGENRAEDTDLNAADRRCNLNRHRDLVVVRDVGDGHVHQAAGDDWADRRRGKGCTGHDSDQAPAVSDHDGLPVLKTYLRTTGPLVACFDVYTDFNYYGGGVYRHTSGSLRGGHACRS